MTTVGPSTFAYTKTLAAGPHTATVTAVNAVGESVASNSQAFKVVAQAGGQSATSSTAWLSGHAIVPSSQAGNTTWAQSYYTPEVVTGFIDGKGATSSVDFTSGATLGMASIISSFQGAAVQGDGSLLFNANQSFFGGSNANPGTNLNVITVGLIPHEVAYSSGNPTANEIARIQAAATSNVDQGSWNAIGVAIAQKGMNFRNFTLRLGHEANGNQYPWATNSDTTRMGYYRTAWANAVTAMKAGITSTGATVNIRFQLCLNARNGGTSVIAGHYAGDAYVDLISIDFYNFDDNMTVAAFNADQGAYPNLIDTPAFANTHGKQFGIGEWGPHSSSYNAVSATVRDQGGPATVDWLLQTLNGLNTQYANSTTYPNGFVSHDSYEDTSSTALSANPLTSAEYVAKWSKPATGSSPSGVPMPTSSTKAGWAYSYGNDFNVSAALGSFQSIYGNAWAGYGATQVAVDTSKVGTYRPDKTLSVHDGQLDINPHYDSATGLYCVASPFPQPSGPGCTNPGANGGSQDYAAGMRTTIRFKASNEIPLYKTAWMLWAASYVWDDGEIDFPEGDLAAGSVITAANHYAGVGSPGSFTKYTSSSTYDVWHTCTLEWLPKTATSAGSCAYYIDGVLLGSNSVNIPSKPMHWNLQTETNLNGTTPAQSTSGHLLIDWLTVEVPG